VRFVSLIGESKLQQSVNKVFMKVIGSKMDDLSLQLGVVCKDTLRHV